MGDFRQAVQVIRSAIGKVVEYREEMLKSSTDFDQHKLTSMYVSVDNKRIGDIEHLQDQVVKTFNNRKERERMRKEMTEDQKDAEQLADDEADEEQQEVIRLLAELSDKNLFEEKRDLEVCHKEEAEVSRKKGKLYFDRKQQLVHTLHADLPREPLQVRSKAGQDDAAGQDADRQAAQEPGNRPEQAGPRQHQEEPLRVAGQEDAEDQVPGQVQGRPAAARTDPPGGWQDAAAQA